MRKVFYVVNGIETTSFEEKKELEKKFGCKAEVKLKEVRADRSSLSQTKQAMLEQFGFVSPKLLNKVMVGN